MKNYTNKMSHKNIVKAVLTRPPKVVSEEREKAKVGEKEKVVAPPEKPKTILARPKDTPLVSKRVAFKASSSSSTVRPAPIPPDTPALPPPSANSSTTAPAAPAAPASSAIPPPVPSNFSTTTASTAEPAIPPAPEISAPAASYEEQPVPADPGYLDPSYLDPGLDAMGEREAHRLAEETITRRCFYL